MGYCYEKILVERSAVVWNSVDVCGDWIRDEFWISYYKLGDIREIWMGKFVCLF